LPQRDPKLAALHALTAGFRAGKAELDRLRYEDMQARLAAKAERRVWSQTKTTAFCLYYVMAGCLVFAFWAGIQG